MNKRFYFMCAICGIVFGTLLYIHSAMAQTRQVKLTWGAVTKTVAGLNVQGAVTYNVYQGAKGSASKAKVQGGVSTPTTTLTAGLPEGEVCFNVSAQTAVNGESALSNEACKSFPYSDAAAPAGLTAE